MKIDLLMLLAIRYLGCANWKRRGLAWIKRLFQQEAKGPRGH